MNAANQAIRPWMTWCNCPIRTSTGERIGTSPTCGIHTMEDKGCTCSIDTTTGEIREVDPKCPIHGENKTVEDASTS